MYFRELDGQIRRWWEVDPKTEKMEMWSPYASNYDNPIRYSDPLGDEGADCCGDFLDALVDAGKKLIISSAGLVNGTLKTATFGAVSSDPSNYRRKLNDEERELYDNSVVKQYSNKVDFVQQVTVKAKAKTAISGSVEFMVCNSKECLPPKEIKFSVSLK